MILTHQCKIAAKHISSKLSYIANLNALLANIINIDDNSNFQPSDEYLKALGQHIFDASKDVEFANKLISIIDSKLVTELEKVKKEINGTSALPNSN